MYLIRHFRENNSSAAEETQPGTQPRVENHASKLHFTHNRGAVQLDTAQYRVQLKMWGSCFDKQKHTALCCSKCSILFGFFFPKTKEALKTPFCRNYVCIKNARSKMTELQHILFSSWWAIQTPVEVNLTFLQLYAQFTWFYLTKNRST